MSHKRSLRLRSQRGFAVAAAVFIIVVLAGMAAYVVAISSAHQAGGAMDIQGSRALQAARSGMDWGIARVVTAPTSFGSGNCQAGAVTVNLSSQGGADFPAHSGFTVSVNCVATPYTDGANLYSYTLTATACNEPGAGGACPNIVSPDADYVERRVSTQVVCNATGTC